MIVSVIVKGPRDIDFVYSRNLEEYNEMIEEVAKTGYYVRSMESQPVMHNSMQPVKTSSQYLYEDLKLDDILRDQGHERRMIRILTCTKCNNWIGHLRGAKVQVINPLDQGGWELKCRTCQEKDVK